MEGDPLDLSRKQKIGQWLGAAWNDAKSFFKQAPIALLLVGSLMLTIYVAYQPATLIDKSWPRFGVLQRSALWLVRGTAFRSLVGPLALLVGYGLYYIFRIRGRRFIVVSDFCVWGNLQTETPAAGVRGRLQDELMRLLAEMRATELGLPPERARARAVATVSSDSSKPKLELGGGFVPETQVTLQYEGISLEGLHTFFRRNTEREVVITGDLFSHPNGYLIVARTKDHGPWEVLIKSLDAGSLGMGLQKLALRILTTLAQEFLPKDANNFVFLQFKADELKEYDLIVRLAHLALESAPDAYEVDAQQNLAKAYFRRGTWLTLRRKYEPASLDFKEATDWFPNYEKAWNSLGKAYQKIGRHEEAKKAFQEAALIRNEPRNSQQ